MLTALVRNYARHQSVELKLSGEPHALDAAQSALANRPGVRSVGVG